MQTYEIPRNYKGEGRILYIFSTKALIYSSIGIAAGFIFYLIMKLLGFSFIGFIIMALFGVIGFAIGTLKVPEIATFNITKKTGGENIDDVIVRWFKFKKEANKIYVYKLEEDTKDE